MSKMVAVISPNGMFSLVRLDVSACPFLRQLIQCLHRTLHIFKFHFRLVTMDFCQISHFRSAFSISKCFNGHIKTVAVSKRCITPSPLFVCCGRVARHWGLSCLDSTRQFKFLRIFLSKICC